MQSISCYNARPKWAKYPKMNSYPQFSSGTHGFFASDGKQEVDDGYSDKMSDGPKTPAVIMLDSCDINPVSLF